MGKGYQFTCGYNLRDLVVVDLPVHQSLARCDNSRVDEIFDMVHRLSDAGRALDDCKWKLPVTDFWKMVSKRKGHPITEKRAFWAFKTNWGVEH